MAEINYNPTEKVGNCLFVREAPAFIQNDGRKRRGAYFLCKCGKEFMARIENVRRGTTRSCGCISNEILLNRNTSHGMAHSPEYATWGRMIQRCENKNNNKYNDYGGRGIKVCDEWRNSFEVFYKDMGSRPSSRHSLDRFPDNNGNYCKENCRWATIKEQALNRRSNVLVKYRGEEKSLIEWTEEFGLNYNRVSERIRKFKWSVEDSFFYKKC